MPRTKSKEVTLVGVKGVKLPASEGTLVAEDSSTLTLQVVAKTGRGRGVKLVQRTYVIPKSSVAYYAYGDDVAASEGEAVATEAPKRRGRPPKAAAEGDAPKKRGRKPKAEKAAAEAPKRRGRPPKSETAEGDAPKKRRGRPPKSAAAAEGDAPKKRGRKPKAEKAAAEGDAPKKRRGRPPKSAAAAEGDAPKRRGRPPKKVPVENGNSEPSQNTSKGSSLFDETF